MEPEALQRHIRKTYFWLRFGLGALAFAFPLLLVGIGYALYGISIQKTMSHYYFAFAPETSDLREFPMRVWFVGILWAIGCFLILYRGFSLTETWLLNFAGISAILVALLPMKAPCTNCSSIDWSIWHNRFAGALFVFIGLVACFCGGNTLKYLKDEQQQRKFRNGYYLLAIVMIVGPFAAWWTSHLGGVSAWDGLFVEWAGIWVFAFYWLVKSREISLSKADEKVAKGEEGEMKTADPPGQLTKQMEEVGSRLLNFRPDGTVALTQR